MENFMDELINKKKNNSIEMFSIKKCEDENKFKFYNSNDKTAFTVKANPNEKKYKISSHKKELSQVGFCRIFNKKIRQTLSEDIKNNYKDRSCVWFLVGEKNGKKTGIQVGRNKNSDCLFSGDIIPDVGAILGIKSKKITQKRYDNYNNLFAKDEDKYDSLTFYFIDINKYFKPDEYEEISKSVPDHQQKAEWAEGKIGAYFKKFYEEKDCIYHSSHQGIEECSVNFYTKKIEKEIENAKTVS